MKYAGLKNAIYAIIAVLTVTTGGALAVHAYQTGNIFIPSGVERGFNANQVSFSGDSDIHNNGDSENDGESQLWEKDKDAQDQSKPQDSQQADYLFQNNEVLPDGLDNKTVSAENLTSGANIFDNSAAAGNGIYNIVSDKNGADLVISGGISSGNIPNQSDSNNTADTNNGNSDANGGGHNGNQNAGGSKPGNSGNSGGGTSSGGGMPSNGGTTKPDSPSTPSKPNYFETVKDPDPELKKPNQYDKPYSEGEIKPIGDPDEKGDYTSGVHIERPGPYGGDTPIIYKGQTIDEKIIFSSLEISILGSNDNRFVFTNDDLGKYIRIPAISFDGGETWITDFPVTVPNDIEDGMMIIKVEYRLSTGSDTWIERNVEYDPEPSVLFILSKQLQQENQVIQEKDVLNIDNKRYPGADSVVCLYRYLKEMVEMAGMDYDNMTKLFPGWTENGNPVPFLYNATAGRHILEPQDWVDLDSNYTVKLEFKWMNNDWQISDDLDASNLAYLQTLKNYKADGLIATLEEWLTGRVETSVFSVPKYIQSIDLEDDADIVADYMDIPSTVIYINNNNGAFSINEGYRVDEDNEYYSSNEGVLCNKNKTEILGIPTKMSHLEIPESVTKIKLDKVNNIKNITFGASTIEALPEIDYGNISNCKIVVDENIFDSFLAQYYENFTDETGNSLASSAEPDVFYHVCNGLLVDNRGGLSDLMESGSTSIVLPASVKVIEAGTFSDSPEVEELILSEDNVVEFEEGCFEGSSISSIFCHTKAQYDSVTKQLSELEITDISVNMLSNSKEGFSYIEKEVSGEKQTVLVSAPDGLTEFDGTVTAGDGSPVVITAINDGAFSNASELHWVTLPESVKSIGKKAFKNCDKLEGVLIDSRDSIRIDDKAFDGCDSLRFIASNAMKASIAEGYAPQIMDPYGTTVTMTRFFFALPEAEGYEAFANQLTGSNGVDHYSIEKIGNGDTDARVLYGNADIDGSEFKWLALRSGIELPDEVTLPEDTIEIYYCAFADTKAASGSGGYTIKNWTDENIWSVGAAAFINSELTGDVILNSAKSDYDGQVEAAAFQGSNITSIDIRGVIYTLGEGVFEDCRYLKSAVFDEMTREPYNRRAFLYPGDFTGCSNLETLTFKSMPNIAIFGTTPFQFNYDWDKDYEAEMLTVNIPDELREKCVYDFRYQFAGYSGLMYDNAYLQMRDNIKFNNWDWITGYPTEETVDEILFNDLLAAENRVRTLLDMDTVEEPTDLYQYHVDVDGNITLTGVPSYVTDVTLSYEQMDMPEGWFVDYIAGGTFKNCTQLESVTVPNNLLGIGSGVFEGVSSDNVTLKLEGANVPELQLDAESGEPFSFGIDPEKLSVEVSEGYINDFIRSWAYPMAGYESISDMFYTFYNEITGNGSEDPGDSGDSGNTGGGSDTDIPELPEWPEWPEWPDYGDDPFGDLFAAEGNTDAVDVGSDDESDDGSDDSELSDEEIYTEVYNKMVEALMPAENDLRTIFGINQITDPEDLISLKGYEVTDLIEEAKKAESGETGDQPGETLPDIPWPDYPWGDFNDDLAGNDGMNDNMSGAGNDNSASDSAGAAAPDEPGSSDADQGFMIKPDDGYADADASAGGETEGGDEIGNIDGTDGTDDGNNNSNADKKAPFKSGDHLTDNDGTGREQENA